MESKWVHAAGGEVHYTDFGGSGRPLVMVHGLGGSSLNWMAVGPELARAGYRVTAPDLLGFGETPLGSRKSSVRNNQRLLDGFLEAVAGEPAVLVGNSMGGLISTLEAAERPERVSRLVLVDPALPGGGRRRPDLSVWMFFAFLMAPLAGAAVLRSRGRRLGAERTVSEVLKVVCNHPGRVAPAVVRAQVELARLRQDMPWAEKALIQAARSIVYHLARGRSFAPTLRRVRPPVLVVQGEDDRLVPTEALRQLVHGRQGWRLEVLEDVGHVPMLEVPERFLEVLEDWLESAEAA